MTLHWTRIGLLAGAALVVIGTCLPWLVGVPPKLLTIGSGSILGITTGHGLFVLAAMALVAVIALRSSRTEPPRRLALAGVIGLAGLALVAASLVLGTTVSEIYETIESAAPTQDIANARIVEVANQLRDFDMGIGAYPVTGGAALIALVAIAGMFAKRRRAAAVAHAESMRAAA